MSDWYKHIFTSFPLAVGVGKGEPYRAEAGWKLTTKHPEPYDRAKAKREGRRMIEKAMNRSADN